MKVVPDWNEIGSIMKFILVSSFIGFMSGLILVACTDEFHLGKSKEELYREMFEVDSLMMRIQMQIDSTSIEFEKFYIDAQRINNGHE
tara:strand:- start:59 stop:322 length:264 start_codon:yes stop_codon:yes gene_type:complete